jgi:site-specific recombinase XerD
MSSSPHQESRDLTSLSPLYQQALLEADYATPTIKKYRHVVKHFLAWYEEENQRALTAEALTPITLIAYRNRLQKDHAATKTVNLHVNALRKWCAWLTEQGYIDRNPATLKEVKIQGVAYKEGLTPAQVDKLLQAAQRSRFKDRNYAIIQLFLQTGLRLEECASLMLDDLTIAERSGSVQVRAGKGNKARVVPLNSTARTALAVYLAPRLNIAATLKAVVATWPAPKNEPLWLSQKKGRLTGKAIAQMVEQLIVMCGTKFPQDTSAHTLRHTFAHGYLQEHPDDIVGLATLLGHSSLDTTRLYCQPSVTELATRVEQMPSNAYH